MLSLCCKDDPAIRLSFVMLAYRTSVQETTGMTPFNLTFGREVQLPIDIMYGNPPSQISTSHSQ